MSALARIISALSSTDREERPATVRASDLVQAALTVRLAIGLEGAAEAVPAGQVDARLGPREGPRDGAQRVDRWRLGRRLPSAGRRSRAEAQVGQLGDRRDVAEERRESRVVVDEAPVGGPRRHRQLVEHRSAGPQRPGRRLVVLGRRRDEDGAGHLLEVPSRDRGVGVVRGDDLALLGELQASIDGSRARSRGWRDWSARRRGRWPRRVRGRCVSSTPWRAAASTSATCARWSIQAAARNPLSLFESE